MLGRAWCAPWMNSYNFLYFHILFDFPLGFLVTATSIGGVHVNGTYFRFAQRSQHHDSKQPVLVVFTEEMAQRLPIYTSPSDAGKWRQLNEFPGCKHLSSCDAWHHLVSTMYIIMQDVTTSCHGVTWFYESWSNDCKTTGDYHKAILVDNNYSVVFLQFSFIVSDLLTDYEETTETRRPFQWNRHQREYIKLLNEEHRKKSGRRNLQTLRTKLANSNSDNTLLHEGGRSNPLPPQGRTKRSTDYYHTPKRRKHTCSRHELYVDFDEIGWSGWIISPRGYNAYHCKGECPFPLGQNQRPTNHATVQSIVHALRIGKNVGTPCCVPNKLYSISLLYFDDDENVILKQYDDMVAASCGCH